jgi:hypothetical protein
LRRPKNVTLYPKLSVQGTIRSNNDVESTSVLRSIKSVQFLSLLDFKSGPPKKVSLTKYLGDPWVKILTTN